MNPSQAATIAVSQGSPFLATNFQKAGLYVNNELAGTYYARYNAYNQQVEVKKTNSDQEVPEYLVKNEDFKLVMGDTELQYTTFIDNKGKKQEAFLISLSEGASYGLFQRHKVVFYEGKKAENSFKADTPSRFVTSTEYYVKEMNTNLVSYIPSKKSKLLKLFKESDKIQVASMIKKNGLNLKNADDLVKLFDFANTISKGYVLKN